MRFLIIIVGVIAIGALIFSRFVMVPDTLSKQHATVLVTQSDPGAPEAADDADLPHILREMYRQVAEDRATRDESSRGPLFRFTDSDEYRDRFGAHLEQAYAMTEAEWARAFSHMHKAMLAEARWAAYILHQENSETRLRKDGDLKNPKRQKAWDSLDTEILELTVLSAGSSILNLRSDEGSTDISTVAYADAATKIGIIREQRIALTQRILKEVFVVSDKAPYLDLWETDP